MIACTPTQCQRGPGCSWCSPVPTLRPEGGESRTGLEPPACVPSSPCGNCDQCTDSEESRFLYAVRRKLRDLKASAAAKKLFAEQAGDTSSGKGFSYANVAELLDQGIPEAPQPDYLTRRDGVALFYAGKVNTLFGDPECGKTWIALGAITAVLYGGGKAAFIDLDHNGRNEIVTRLLMLGTPKEALRDPECFRYCEPEDAEELVWYAADIASWAPNLAVVDSLGELMPMLGLSSNSPDDYSIGNRKVLTRIANSGAGVIAIDHLPKDDDAREKGQIGTIGKKRAANGVTLRVTVKDQFTPGVGGSANLTIHKDRPGGLRKHSPQGKNAPAGRFVMSEGMDGVDWYVTKPDAACSDDPQRSAKRNDADIAELDGLAPPPRSQRDVKERMGWSSDRAMKALKTWRDLREPE